LPKKLSEKGKYLEIFMKEISRNKDIKSMAKEISSLGRQFPLV